MAKETGLGKRQSEDFNLAEMAFPSLVLNHSTAVFPPVLSSSLHLAEHRFSNSFAKSSLRREKEKPHSGHISLSSTSQDLGLLKLFTQGHNLKRTSSWW